MLKGFRDFVLRGNVLDLAVAVVIGTAFGSIVTSLVKDLITPLIAAIVQKPDFSYLVLKINGANITLKGSGKINVQASSDVVIKGSKVSQN